jgi:hypothetical protein
MMKEPVVNSQDPTPNFQRNPFAAAFCIFGVGIWELGFATAGFQQPATFEGSSVLERSEPQTWERS